MQRFAPASNSTDTKQAAKENNLIALYQLFNSLREETWWRKLPFIDMPIRRPLYIAIKILLLTLDKEAVQLKYRLSSARIEVMQEEARNFIAHFASGQRLSNLRYSSREYCILARWCEAVLHNVMTSVDSAAQKNCADPDAFLLKMLDKDILQLPEIVLIPDEHDKNIHHEHQESRNLNLTEKERLRSDLTQAMKEGIDVDIDWINTKDTLAKSDQALFARSEKKSEHHYGTMVIMDQAAPIQSDVKEAVHQRVYPDLSMPQVLNDSPVVAMASEFNGPYVLPLSQEPLSNKTQILESKQSEELEPGSVETPVSLTTVPVQMDVQQPVAAQPVEGQKSGAELSDLRAKNLFQAVENSPASQKPPVSKPKVKSRVAVPI